MQFFAVILFSFIYSIDGYGNITSLTSLDQKSINNTGLSITSFKFNPSSTSSEWIDRRFGSKSVFHPVRSISKVLSSSRLTNEEIIHRSSLIHSQFHLLPAHEWPICSIELLGFGLLGLEYPLLENLRFKQPSFGNGTLLFLKKKIPCYYRALYENWRLDSEFTVPNFWSVVFYCPILSNHICEMINLRKTSKHRLAMKMMMQLEYSVWNASFIGKLHHEVKLSSVSPLSSTSNDRNRKIGICLAIPYVSNDSEKYKANGAMIFEWVRYYLKLGLKLFIYDRDGSNYNYISNGQNTPAEKISNEMAEHVIYHDYTIRGLLDPSMKGLKYDNTELQFKFKSKMEEKSLRSRFESQGE